MGAASDASAGANPDACAGWFGKLPSLGDFAQRRLPPEFVDRWDDWLGAEIARVRTRHEGVWLQAYLASPVWRFVLLPGVLGAGAKPWAGVLMPSVDKVGRYFPLTLARELPAVPSHLEAVDPILAWLHDLDDIAADALHEDWSLDELERQLLGKPLPAAPDGGGDEDTVFDLQGPPGTLSLADAFDELRMNGGPGLMVRAPLRGEIARVLALQAFQGVKGFAVWWCDTPHQADVLVSRGLPTHRLFDSLFGLADGSVLQADPMSDPLADAWSASQGQP